MLKKYCGHCGGHLKKADVMTKDKALAILEKEINEISKEKMSKKDIIEAYRSDEAQGKIYRPLAKFWHPDKKAPGAAEVMPLINDANDALTTFYEAEIAATKEKDEKVRYLKITRLSLYDMISKKDFEGVTAYRS